MSETRELSMDDYLSMLRRRLKVLVIPALFGVLGGFGISKAFTPRYSSTATVLVEGQKVPDSYVMPVITSDFAQRVQSLSEQVLIISRLRPVVHGLGLVKPDDEHDLIANIQQNMQVSPVITTMSAAAAGAPTAKTKKPTAGNEPLPGFTVQYTDSEPDRAQKVTNALAQMFVNENLRSRADVAQSTTDFLSGQVEEAKRALDEQDAKLATFKKQYMGQLPTDIDNNMHMLMALNSQLDATTQTLNRAQQDKAYTESMLAQQIAAWKNGQSSTNPATLEQTLTQLQAQLMQLQARYTDDHPDVIKTKADIAEVQSKLKEANAAASNPSAEEGTEKANASEPAEIRQLRLQIHQYQSVIDQATSDQKRLQGQIGIYESRTSMSPGVEEQYKLLTRDNDNAVAFYKDLLAKKSSAQVGTSMENKQEGEQMYIGTFAAKAESPSFPNRPLFAAGGMGVGLALGALLAMFLELSDKSIRTEKDAANAVDLPMLISVPWLGGDEGEVNGNGRRRFWGRNDSAPPKEHEHAGV